MTDLSRRGFMMLSAAVPLLKYFPAVAPSPPAPAFLEVHILEDAKVCWVRRLSVDGQEIPLDRVIYMPAGFRVTDLVNLIPELGSTIKTYDVEWIES